MKNVFLGLLVAGLVITNNGVSTLAAYSSTAAEACPVLPIGIGRVAVSPLQPARQHFVIVSWEARAPQCYTIEKFYVKGEITFANGAKKNFVQTTPGNQTTVQIQVPGLLTLPAAANPSLAPRSVEVEVTAEASAPVTGSGNNFGTRHSRPGRLYFAYQLMSPARYGKRCSVVIRRIDRVSRKPERDQLS